MSTHTTDTPPPADTRKFKLSKDHLFLIVGNFLTFISLVLTGITLGRQLTEMLSLSGAVGTATAWGIALLFEAMWVGSLFAARRAINQRSTVGIVVTLTATALSAVTSCVILATLGHIGVWSAAPAIAALFQGLGLFVEHALTTADTELSIRETSAQNRKDLALARSEANRLTNQARAGVLLETAQYRAEAARLGEQTKVLTKTQGKIDKARAKAERQLRKLDEKYGADAKSFTGRTLDVQVPQIAMPGALAVGELNKPASKELAAVENSWKKRNLEAGDEAVESFPESTQEIPIISLEEAVATVEEGFEDDFDGDFDFAEGELVGAGPVRTVPADSRPQRISVTLPVTDLSDAQRKNRLIAAEFWLRKRMNGGMEPARGAFAQEKGVSAGQISRILNKHHPESSFTQEEFEEYSAQLAS